MVQVKSSQLISQKPFVNVEIKGVSEALRYIRAKGQDIKDGADLGVFQAANFFQQEVQESIIGNRSEIKSVDTGRFANSIKIDKLKDEEYKVYTEVEYAKFLEYGTSFLAPRAHFRNTKARVQRKIRDIIDSSIKKEI